MYFAGCVSRWQSAKGLYVWIQRFFSGTVICSDRIIEGQLATRLKLQLKTSVRGIVFFVWNIGSQHPIG